MPNSMKVIVSGSLLLLSIAVLIAYISPATYYELDIYTNTPIVIWIILSIAALVGASIIIHQVFTKRYKNNNTWIYGLLILILSRLAFLYIPYIRGYVTWQGDNISHYGYLADIVSSGHFYAENYYPITHSCLSQIILLTNIPVRQVANFSTGILSVFFIVLTYLLATEILPHKGQQIFAALVAGMVLINGIYEVFLTPNGWSILMLPLLLLCYVKKYSQPVYVIPFIILLVMYPMFHPLSGLMIGLAFIAVLVFRLVMNPILKRRGIILNGLRFNTTGAAIFIEFIVLISWVLSFNVFNPNIRLMWSQIISGRSIVLEDIGSTLQTIDITGWDAVILFIKMYGSDTILIILSIIGFLLILRELKKGCKEDVIKTFLCLDIGVMFLFFGFFYLLYIVGIPGLSGIGAERALSYVAMLTPIFSGIVLYQICNMGKIKFISVTSMIVSLLLISILSFRDAYQSPYVVMPNPQITYRDLQGSEWFIQNKNKDVICMNNLGNIARLIQGIIGYEQLSERKDISRSNPNIPDHFSYNLNDYLGQGLTGEVYFLLDGIDRITYVSVWKMVGRFNYEDFAKLERDISTCKVYDNGEVSIYIASPLIK